MEPNQNQSTQNPAPAAPENSGGTGSPPPSAPPQQNLNAGMNNTVENKDQAGGKDKKKMAVVAVLVLIILMIFAVVGYYAYSSMGSSTKEEPVNTITEAPTPTVEPTGPADPIQNEEELDQVLDDIDNATDGAMMEEEVQGLRTDSNF